MWLLEIALYITEQRHQVTRERKKGSSVTCQTRSLHFNRFHFFQNHFKSKLQQAVNNNHEVQAAGAISCIVNTKDVNKRRTCSRFKICQKLWIKNLYCQLNFSPYFARFSLAEAAHDLNFIGRRQYHASIKMKTNLR